MIIPIGNVILCKQYKLRNTNVNALEPRDSPQSPGKERRYCHILGILAGFWVTSSIITITVSVPQVGHSHCSNAVSYDRTSKAWSYSFRNISVVKTRKSLPASIILRAGLGEQFYLYKFKMSFTFWKQADENDFSPAQFVTIRVKEISQLVLSLMKLREQYCQAKNRVGFLLSWRCLARLSVPQTKPWVIASCKAWMCWCVCF